MANFPAGTYIFSDGAVPSGWAHHTAYGGKYIRGAPYAANLGGTGGSLTHTHASCSLSSVAGHNHGGTKTVQSSITGGKFASGGTGGIVCTKHSHQVTVTIANNASHTHTVGETGTADNDPSHTVLMLLRKS